MGPGMRRKRADLPVSIASWLAGLKEFVTWQKCPKFFCSQTIISASMDSRERKKKSQGFFFFSPYVTHTFLFGKHHGSTSGEHVNYAIETLFKDPGIYASGCMGAPLSPLARKLRQPSSYFILLFYWTPFKTKISVAIRGAMTPIATHKNRWLHFLKLRFSTLNFSWRYLKLTCHAQVHFWHVLDRIRKPFHFQEVVINFFFFFFLESLQLSSANVTTLPSSFVRATGVGD